MSSGYILNLTTCFNAENFMYYFLPGISSGKILLFDKLTRNQLSNHENKQLGDINRKLNYLKEDLELSRLLHNYSISDIKINIVLDFKKWIPYKIPPSTKTRVAMPLPVLAEITAIAANKIAV